jgi:hypothetical protein
MALTHRRIDWNQLLPYDADAFSPGCDKFCGSPSLYGQWLIEQLVGSDEVLFHVPRFTYYTKQLLSCVFNYVIYIILYYVIYIYIYCVLCYVCSLCLFPFLCLTVVRRWMDLKFDLSIEQQRVLIEFYFDRICHLHVPLIERDGFLQNSALIQLDCDILLKLLRLPFSFLWS